MSQIQLLSHIPKKILTIVLLLRLYLSLFNVWVSYVIQQGINIASYSDDNSKFYFLLIALTISTCLYGWIYYTYGINVERIRIKIAEELATDLVHSLIVTKTRDNEKLENNTFNLINQDIVNISRYFSNGIMPLIEMGLVIVGGVFYIFYFSPIMGSCYLILGIGFYWVNRYSYRRMKMQYKNYIESDDTHKKFLQEVYSAFPIIRIFNSLTEWLRMNQENLYIEKRRNFSMYSRSYSFNSSFMDSAINIAQLLMLFLGFWLVTEGNILIGTMIGLWNAGAGSILYAFSDLPNTTEYLSNYHSSIERLQRFFQPGDSLNESNDNLNYQLEDGIYIRNLTHKFDEKELFNNMNYHFKATGIHFIVGASGSGKSTLLKMIAKENSPQQGQIFATKAQTYYDLTKNIAYVPQKNGILNISLLDNIRFDNPEISECDVIQMLEKFGLEYLISRHSNGLNAQIGKDISLSPGEMKRISLIRSILSNRSYLFLDEPFADIDLKSQGIVMTALREYANNHSVIIITHTFNFIEDNDTVLQIGG